MTVVTLDTLKDTSVKFGTFYSWNEPKPAITGEHWARQERVKGEKFSTGNRRSRDGKYRSGGPFYSIKFRTLIDSDAARTYRGGWNDNSVAYVGRYSVLWDSTYSYSFMEMFAYDTDTINSKAYMYGAEAYAKLRPDKPDYSPLTSLAELARELPGILGNFKDFQARYQRELRRRRNLGQHLNQAGKTHLAIMFGIMPIIGDVQSFLKAAETANKRASQLIRDNGKWVRRRAYLTGKPNMNDYTPGWRTDYSVGSNTLMRPVHVTQCYSTNAAKRAHTVNSAHRHVEVWAVGKSKYFLPKELMTHPLRLRILQRRIKADMTIRPDTIYNLIPWSWLLDYFTSFGSFMEAISGGLADHVVFQYAYVMRKEVHIDRTVMTQYTFSSKTVTVPVTCTVYREGTLKTRVSASLFGFGVSEEDLSPYQWSILGALGASRL